MSKIKLATEWMQIPEQIPSYITVGDLMQLLERADPDMPVTFVKYADGEINFVDGVEIRHANQSGEIMSRDEEDSCKDTMPILVLSVLG